MTENTMCRLNDKALESSGSEVEFFFLIAQRGAENSSAPRPEPTRTDPDCLGEKPGGHSAKHNTDSIAHGAQDGRLTISRMP